MVRHEREHPGELAHIDVKLGRIGCVGHDIHGDRTTRVRGIGWEYLHVAVDNASRLAYAEVWQRALTSIHFLCRAVGFFARLGIHVQRVMTDNGSGYLYLHEGERVDRGARLRSAPHCS